MLLIMSALPRRKQTAETLLSLSPAETANLKEGINFFRNKTTGKEYIIYKEKGHLKACKNLCKHQGGLFIKDIEDLDARYTVLCSLARGPVCLLDILNDMISKLLLVNFPLVSLGWLPDFKMLCFV